MLDIGFEPDGLSFRGDGERDVGVGLRHGRYLGDLVENLFRKASKLPTKGFGNEFGIESFRLGIADLFGEIDEIFLDTVQVALDAFDIDLDEFDIGINGLIQAVIDLAISTRLRTTVGDVLDVDILADFAAIATRLDVTSEFADINGQGEDRPVVELGLTGIDFDSHWILQGWALICDVVIVPESISEFYNFPASCHQGFRNELAIEGSGFSWNFVLSSSRINPYKKGVAMLILGRRRGQSFYVGDVKISLRDFAKGAAQIEVVAPKDVRVIPMEFLPPDSHACEPPSDGMKGDQIGS